MASLQIKELARVSWKMSGTWKLMDRFATRRARATCALVAVLTISSSAVLAVSTYDNAGQRAADWLISSMIPADRTWGNDQDLKYLTATEVALALASWNRRSVEYYSALSWISNHSPGNVDYSSRRVLALLPSGGSVESDIDYLGYAKSLNLSAPGNGAWGLNAGYQGSALDTALVLQAVPVSASDPAITFLKSAQLAGTDKGWALGQETTSDSITTAQVLIALIPYRSGDSTLVTPVANGIAALNSKVTTSSATLHKALAALANLKNNPGSSQGTTLLNNLVTTQGSDGSWGGDVQATAVALRALAFGAGRDADVLQAPVTVLDDKLRAAINAALSRSALDTLNQGELAQLTTLNIAGQGVTNLTGLEYAANLTYLDASYNNITSWAPVDGLSQQPATVRDGNPGYPATAGDAPTLPEWAAIFMGGLLFLMAQRRAGWRWRRSTNDVAHLR
jgi:hypothetical protein